MEYARNMIMNVGYKGVDGIRSRINRIKYNTVNIRVIIAKLVTITMTIINSFINIIKNNKFISLTLGILFILIVLDFILINCFMNLFLTL